MTMKIGIKSLASLIMGISIVIGSVSSVHAQVKPDPKVMKDCEAVNETYDRDTYYLFLQAPLSKNRDLARVEIGDKELDMGTVLIDCDKIDMQTWKSMKKDYSNAIKSANLQLKRIVAKYNLLPIINLTCVKSGKIVKIDSTNPKCPKGYKELYKQ